MSARAFHWYGACEPTMRLVLILLLGGERRFSLPWPLDYAICLAHARHGASLPNRPFSFAPVGRDGSRCGG